VKGVTVITHPLVQHGLTRLRDRRTGHEEFRRLLGQVGVFLVYEAMRSFAVRRTPVVTPLEKSRGMALRRGVVLVPVLRAGLGMLDAVLQFVPGARVGFIGLAREEKTLVAHSYHKSLTHDLRDCEVILLDPMLATGGSAVAAMAMLAEQGARQVRMVNLVAAPEGIRHLRARYPALPVFTAAIDRRLNEKGYILPGLGDAGFRLYGV
jgi:uracil phosphoribosyltransferase